MGPWTMDYGLWTNGLLAGFPGNGPNEAVQARERPVGRTRQTFALSGGQVAQTAGQMKKVMSLVQ